MKCWVWLWLAAVFGAATAPASEVSLATGAGSAAPVKFALRKLAAALRERGDFLTLTEREVATTSISVEPPDDALGPDGFALRMNGGQLGVVGGDVRGTMYGLLDVAEQIRLGTSPERISPRVVHARFGLRGIKFNLPFAAYRNGPYLEQHQATCRDLGFWEAFLDMMAENRFNTLTLWSLHPYHYLVVPKDFPEAQTFPAAQMAAFRQLWTGVFRLAKERGVETYLVNWNTFVSPAFSKAHGLALYSQNWKHIGAGPKDRIVEDYMRECVTQVIDEYPDLTGLGTTLGERMGGQTPDERRTWLEKTFYAGIAAAKRPVKFIYRAPLSANAGSGGSTSVENDRATRAQVEQRRPNLLAPVSVDFKYNASHGHSSPELFIVHGGRLSDAYWNPHPTAYRVDWTMRNEDFFILRWGQPDFVRQFAQNNSADFVGGAIIGSETYIPAFDFITKEGPHKSWRYAFERQWLFYSIWGHLLHEPALPDARFADMLGARFGLRSGSDLLQAWKWVSDIPLRVASFYQGTWDGALYTEGFCTWVDDGARRLIDINALIDHPVLDAKHYLNIADYVKAGAKSAPGVLSPPALAALIDAESDQAQTLVRGLRAKGNLSPALDAELTDVEAWCTFGSYFAHKLRAGVALALARANRNVAEQQLAVAALERAAGDWRQLGRLGARFNQLPVLSAAREPFSWDSLMPDVLRDIALAQAPLPGSKPVP